MKKRNKNDKNTNFMMKNSKKKFKKCMKALSNYIRVRGNFTETESILVPYCQMNTLYSKQMN